MGIIGLVIILVQTYRTADGIAAYGEHIPGQLSVQQLRLLQLPFILDIGPHACESNIIPQVIAEGSHACALVILMDISLKLFQGIGLILIRLYLLDKVSRRCLHIILLSTRKGSLLGLILWQLAQLVILIALDLLVVLAPQTILQQLCPDQMSFGLDTQLL